MSMDKQASPAKLLPISTSGFAYPLVMLESLMCVSEISFYCFHNCSFLALQKLMTDHSFPFDH